MLKEVNQGILKEDDWVELYFYPQKDGYSLAPIPEKVKNNLRFKGDNSNVGYLNDDLFLIWFKNDKDGLYYLFYLKYIFWPEDKKRYKQLRAKDPIKSSTELELIYSRAIVKFEPFIGNLVRVLSVIEYCNV